MVGANLGGGRRQGSGHGGGWRALGGEWVGQGGRWEGERANGGERGPGGGLLWRGDGASWARASASSCSSLRASGRCCAESREFVEVDYAQGKKRGSGECGKAGPRRGQRLARSGSSVRTRGEPEREREEGDDSVACCGRRGDLGGHEGEALGGRRRL